MGLGLLIIELIFGNWIDPNDLNKLNIIRSKELNLNISDIYVNPYPEIVYTRDKYGLRGSFDNTSEIDILTVGGSTTNQLYIADGKTWQDVIQDRFLSIGKDIKVANAGIDGQSTFGHIKNFEWWFPYIPDLKPKYILFYVGINDFYKDDGYVYDALLDKNKSHGKMLKDKSAIYNIYRIINETYFARYVYDIGHNVSIDFSKVEWTQIPIQKDYTKLMNKRLNEYAERLTILIAKTREFGSEPIFATQPTRKYRFNKGVIEGIKAPFPYDSTLINGVDYYHMMKLQDRTTCLVGSKNQVTCLDMAKGNLWIDEDYYDYIHMTPSGVKRVGEYLFEALIEFY